MSDDPYRKEVWSPSSGSGGTADAAGAETSTGADKVALIALTTTVVVVLGMCIPGGGCLLPFAPLVIGIMAVVQSKNAANPDRSRTYGWISIIAGLIPMIVFIVIAILYGGVIIAAITSGEYRY
jgi:Na+-driven multidrug efflux pump